MTKRAKKIVDAIVEPPAERVLDDGTVVRKRKKSRKKSKKGSLPSPSVVKDLIGDEESTLDSPAICGDERLVSKFFSEPDSPPDPDAPEDSKLTLTKEVLDTVLESIAVSPLHGSLPGHGLPSGVISSGSEVTLTDEQMEILVSRVSSEILPKVVELMWEAKNE